jgi:hypothetical protein
MIAEAWSEKAVLMRLRVVGSAARWAQRRNDRS